MNKILIKLFDINIVAKSFLGFSSSFLIKSVLGFLLFFTSVFDNEKNATSVPDIKADKIRRINKVSMPIKIDQLKSKVESIFVGSGSNSEWF